MSYLFKLSAKITNHTTNFGSLQGDTTSHGILCAGIVAIFPQLVLWQNKKNHRGVCVWVGGGACTFCCHTKNHQYPWTHGEVRFPLSEVAFSLYFMQIRQTSPKNKIFPITWVDTVIWCLFPHFHGQK